MAANNARQDQLEALLQQIDRLNADNQALRLQAAADTLQLQAAAAAAAVAASPRWKMIPPIVREPHTKMIRSKPFHWCIHHMAWTLHHPDHCRICLGASKAVSPPSTASLATATAMLTKAILGRIETTLSCVETTLSRIESAGEILSRF